MPAARSASADGIRNVSHPGGWCDRVACGGPEVQRVGGEPGALAPRACAFDLRHRAAARVRGRGCALQHRDGQASGIPERSALPRCVRSDRIGGSWLAQGGLSVRWCRGQVAGTSTPMSHQAGARAREPSSASVIDVVLRHAGEVVMARIPSTRCSNALDGCRPSSGGHDRGRGPLSGTSVEYRHGA